jgi:hypothetical protein
MNKVDCNKQHRLYILGARINDLLIRTPGFVEQTKLFKTETMFWLIMNDSVSDNKWDIFYIANKLKKYENK